MVSLPAINWIHYVSSIDDRWIQRSSDPNHRIIVWQRINQVVETGIGKLIIKVTVRSFEGKLVCRTAYGYPLIVLYNYCGKTRYLIKRKIKLLPIAYQHRNALIRPHSQTYHRIFGCNIPRFCREGIFRQFRNHNGEEGQFSHNLIQQ